MAANPGGSPSIPTANPWVPHISLVFREMWDTTNLNLQIPRRPVPFQVGDGDEAKPLGAE